MNIIITLALILLVLLIVFNRPKCESYIENRLYQSLLKERLYVQPQKRVGPYRIDLALSKYKIAIECDGKKYHSSPKAKLRDARKDKYLEQRGWLVLRYSGEDINNRLLYVINDIKKRTV